MGVPRLLDQRRDGGQERLWNGRREFDARLAAACINLSEGLSVATGQRFARSGLGFCLRERRSNSIWNRLFVSAARKRWEPASSLAISSAAGRDEKIAPSAIQRSRPTFGAGPMSRAMWSGMLSATCMRRENLALLHAERIFHHLAGETALDERLCEEGALDEAEVAAFGIFLALRQHQFVIR